MPLNPGTVLSERYQIKSVLGRGGMGAVYLARMPSLGDKLVAIKAMQRKADDTDMAVEQFRKEATFLANLDHPNLVKVSDFFVEDDCHYLVMQYVQGSTLQQLLNSRSSPAPQALALDWAEQLCSVLKYLHTCSPPILFRDLKPSNVMLDEQNRIRLIDFGIARVLEPGQGTSTFLQGVGSPGYAPLEQYEGQGTTDARSDIYSLGATLFHLLANQAPPSPIGLVSQQMSLPSLCELNPQVEPALNTLVHHMMALRQADRPANVAWVWDELKRIRSGSTVTVVDTATEYLPPPPRAGFPKWAIAAALFAALGLPFLPKAMASEGRKPTAIAAQAARTIASTPPQPKVAVLPEKEKPVLNIKPRFKPRRGTRPRVKGRQPERKVASSTPRVSPKAAYPKAAPMQVPKVEPTTVPYPTAPTANSPPPAATERQARGNPRREWKGKPVPAKMREAIRRKRQGASHQRRGRGKSR